MFWGGLVFTGGWILRILSSYYPQDLNYYISQNVLILAAQPIFSGTQYAILSRLMHHLPMYAPLHPHRVMIFFVYIGAAVESLTVAGASMIASNPGDMGKHTRGGLLLSIALALQGAVECFFVFLVALVHHRCAQAQRPIPRNIRSICIMLYGTSTLVLIRCICRAIESFSTETSTTCNTVCQTVLYNEWYLYAFEAAPIVLYTFWLNIVHPGLFLPRQRCVYLDIDGKTRRMGPGWIDRRSRLATFLDPFDISGILNGQPSHEKFWDRSEDWPVVEVGNTTQRSSKKAYIPLLQHEVDVSSKP